MSEPKKPDVFNTSAPTNGMDFDAIYGVNTPGISDAEREALREMANNAREQFKLREEKFKAYTEVTNPVEVESNNIVEEPTEVIEAPSFNMTTPVYKVEKDSKAQWDLVELPSKGYPYNIKGERLKVAYLTAADEDILTSPGILESGEFFDYLFGRKILDDNITYNDLLAGDRDAIMIWLRANAYGHEYPVTFTDPDDDDKPFERVLDLSEIPVKYLTLTPNERGYLEFELPISKKKIEFKYLTVGETSALEMELKFSIEKKDKITRGVTRNMEMKIISIDGETNKEKLKEMISVLPIGDSRAFRKFYNENEPGMDLTVSIETPGGTSHDTFLPIEFDFFWPDL